MKHEHANDVAVAARGLARNRPATIFLAGVLSMAGSVQASFAQEPTRADRPYRGLFAGDVGEPEQSLSATGSLGAGYDTNVLAAALRSRRIARPSGSGGFLVGSAGLAYSLSRETFQIASSIGSSGRYYPELSTAVLHTQNANLSASARLLQKPGLNVDGSVRYLPYTLLGALGDPDLLPVDDPSLVDSGSAADLNHYMLYRGGIGLDQPLSRRVTFSTNYRYQHSNRRDRDLWVQSASSELKFGLSRYASLVAGYRVREGHYADGRVHRNHTPVVRVEASRPLSLTRRTSASVGGGSAFVQRSGQQRIVATGDASLTHEIGRTWSLVAAYSRGFRYLETFDEPLFSDAATVSFGGLINRRLQATSSVRAAKGYTGFATERSYSTVSANAVLAFALSRYSNVSVTYSHYRYEFDREIRIAEGALTDFRRHSVIARLGLWVPLLTQQRRN